MIEPQISFHPDHYFQKAESLTMPQPDITNSTDGSDRMTVRDDHLPPYIGDFPPKSSSPSQEEKMV